jgi:hypothetical protein
MDLALMEEDVMLDAFRCRGQRRQAWGFERLRGGFAA